MLAMANCCASQRYGFVLHFLQVFIGCVGLNRQGRSLRYSGGPKKDPNHRSAQQFLVSNIQSVCSIHSGHQQAQNYKTRMRVRANVNRDCRITLVKLNHR